MTSETDPPRVTETHVSILFFVGDRVYKLKKPVKLDFLDFSTRSRREVACQREVELNRRLAPDVYLGVSDVLGTDGQPCDHLVVMRRMPDDRRLSTLVQHHASVDECVRETARVIAALHAAADTSPAIATAGSVSAVRANWQASFKTLEPFVGSVLDPDLAERVETLAMRYVDGRGPLFASRVTNGNVRDGHGDLLADDIFCLDDGPRVLDCLEFSDQLRHGDVLADVAFLAMDLERIGAPEVARRFLGWYREFSAENSPETLAHHYIAYRAHVRAKVACLRADQGDTSAPESARQLLQLAHDHLARGRVVLTLAGGLPGTGKSTLAVDLADRLGWSVMRSDELRKELAGLDHSARYGFAYGEGLYDESETTATYETLLERAKTLLELGEPVILDASWSADRWRDEARALARATKTDLVELRCDVPRDLARARIESRAREGTDASDATTEVADRMAADADPWPTATTIDTRVPRAASVAAAVLAVTTVSA